MGAFIVNDALRAIPPINEVLDCSEELIGQWGRETVLVSARAVIEDYRAYINSKGEFTPGEQSNDKKFVLGLIVEKLKTKLNNKRMSGLKRVINATGTILHTNLGRAPLPEKALELMTELSRGYSNLEFDIETGGRGSRHSHIEAIITGITGAESAMIVNNNAAAVFLCLNTLAVGRQVVVSRGQQIEIGGSFRIPDIIARSGANMVEVGTTNKTRITDYLNAVTEETSVFLKVHTSNYKITGFTEEVTLEELAAAGSERGITVIEDLGSGCLLDLTGIGLPYEPTVQDSIKSGADIVTFSGDKLLGGPQAGIIAGRKNLIERIKKNPLTRMVRCDKTAIAAMAAVLSLYSNPDKVVDDIPALKMMSLKEEELQSNALELADMIHAVLGSKCETEITEVMDEVGGGSLPGVVLNGRAVALKAAAGANELQERLRRSEIPVICRINKDKVIINIRTIEKSDYPVIAEALAGILE